ncbi:hypothetical protein pb186bvf_015180 [Paramecium bursaria]
MFLKYKFIILFYINSCYEVLQAIKFIFTHLLLHIIETELLIIKDIFNNIFVDFMRTIGLLLVLLLVLQTQACIPHHGGGGDRCDHIFRSCLDGCKRQRMYSYVQIQKSKIILALLRSLLDSLLRVQSHGMIILINKYNNICFSYNVSITTIKLICEQKNIFQTFR